ncbi:hypothetical protein Pcinc_032411 [Petrolisthes cinctipes]|uniref:Uncharacterized protein n=1 Tax=Petrolisthes cinctipes TaxID=88211 RepID=A0AAE1EUG3_PETCI|nr:hypothetical protein Pcinc_032411 [Petrolisthes cinctipes]
MTTVGPRSGLFILVFLLHLLSAKGLVAAAAEEAQQQEEEEVKDEVRVLSLQRGVWLVPSEHVYARYNFSRDAGFEVFSEGFDVHISYKDTDDNSDPFYSGNSGEYFDSWFDNKEQSGLPRWTVVPEVWRHVCHTYSDATYTLYWEGKVVFSGRLQGSWPVMMNGTLVLGQEQDNLGGGFDRNQIFRGDLAQISLWDRVLSSRDVAGMAECRDVGRGNLFSSDTVTFELHGDPLVQVSWHNLSTLCQTKEHNVVFPEERSLQEARTFCHRFNATLAVPTTKQDNQRLTDQLGLFKNVCVPTAQWKLWLGITDNVEDGVWRDFQTNSLITYLNFPPLNAGSSYTCASMKTNGFWDGDRCTNKRCVACHFDHTDFLYLRGLCFDNNFRMRFRVQDHINGRPFFRGYNSYIIFWGNESREWQLLDTITNQTLLSTSAVPQDDYPIGKHRWVVQEVVCGRSKGDELLLSLAPCEDHLFTCNSGDCIQDHLRCDFRYDCADGSDEVNCGVIEMLDDLQRQLPPTGQQGTFLSVAPSFTLTRIADVDDIYMAITLEFRLTFTWVDERLRLRYLKVKKNGTILSEADAEKVWRPRYQLVNLEGGQKQVLSQSLVVRSALNGTRPHYNNVDMDLVYPGWANNISLVQRYTARVTCYFELYAYPFDVQVCSVDIELPPELEDYVKLSIDDGEARYTGPQELSKYIVKDIRFSENSGGNELSLQFTLHRRQGIVVLSNFLPSAMLLVVSWATLFIRLEAINVRAIMSLTTLLVLYTLFANMSRSLPATAAIKLIDIWFFFIIFLLFANIMIHVFVDDRSQVKSSPAPIPTTQKTTTTTTTTTPNRVKEAFTEGRKERSTLVQMLGAWSSSRMLRFYRLVIFPVVVLIFNIYFWAAVLLSFQ